MSNTATSEDRAIQAVLLKSRRRCPLCYIAGRDEPRHGSIIHIDGDKLNRAADNLVYICIDHHAELDKGGSITLDQLKKARSTLYASIGEDQPQAESRGPWLAYEDLIADLLRAQLSEAFGDHFAFYRTRAYPGRSGFSYHIDLSAEFSVAGVRMLVVFEVKYRRGKLGAEEVLQLASKIQDIGASKGVLVSAGGFSVSAIQVARSQGIALMEVREGDRKIKVLEQ